MATSLPQSASFKVYARWRPLSQSETRESEIERSTSDHESKQSISLSSQSNLNRSRKWKSGPSFANVFTPTAINRDVFENVVKPTLPQVMEGATCNFFAYGHTGSGKTHTIIGYDYEDEKQLGLCLAAARDLVEAISDINTNPNEPKQPDEKEQLGIAVRIYEVRGKYAYDLLNLGIECHVREGPDGQTHIRGQTEMLEGGKVRVRPIVALPCWTFEDLRKSVLAGLEMRKVGSSSVHSESSRTHAILEFEIVTRQLLDLRDAVIERESELVPVGKRATDIYLEEHQKSLIKTPEGKYMMNPECPLNQARIDEAEAEKNKYEARLKAAEHEVDNYFKSCQYSCLGGKYIFVDLAGSEYYDTGTSATVGGPKQTPQERQQGRQINTDLFALKEVIRASSLNSTRIPFRSSPLTMVLRSHFLATRNGQSAMILTVSPSEVQYAATVNTLKYGNLVGVASGN